MMAKKPVVGASAERLFYVVWALGGVNRRIQRVVCTPGDTRGWPHG